MYMNICSVYDMMDSIKEHTNLGMDQEGELWRDLYMYYSHEVSTILQYVQTAQESGKNVSAVLTPFTEHGSQLIADFSVTDLTKEEEDKFNWHGQNVSRWIYAGALVYSLTDNRISSHH